MFSPMPRLRAIACFPALLQAKPELRFICCSIALWLFVFSAVVSKVQAGPLGTAESFAEIALQNEHGETGWMPVRRWHQPIYLYIDSRVGDTQLQHRLVKLQLERLSTLTGHPMSVVSAADEANLYLLFERETRMDAALAELAPEQTFSAEFLNTSVCFGTISLDQQQAITRALVVIPPDRARYRGKFNSCIIEELTQVMGLVNDSERVFPSIFNDRSIDQELTELDQQLLRLLYHPTIQAGMTRAEVAPLIDTLIEQGAHLSDREPRVIHSNAAPAQ